MAILNRLNLKTVIINHSLSIKGREKSVFSRKPKYPFTLIIPETTKTQITAKRNYINPRINTRKILTTINYLLHENKCEDIITSVNNSKLSYCSINDNAVILSYKIDIVIELTFKYTGDLILTIYEGGQPIKVIKTPRMY